MKRRALLLHSLYGLSGIAGLRLFSAKAQAQSEFYAPTRPKMGFVFIGASWCPYCKRAAPYLRQFADVNQIEVLVVSIDGRAIAPFYDVLHDPQHPLVGATPRVPTTLLWSAASNQIVGRFEGFRNAQTYVRNLTRLVNTEIGGTL